ncbi:MAG: hypothetical protein M3P04_10755 [Actinomycetota bacterium]|nr:hypothetical protein [Actinomycetota bacterium]
MPTPFLGSTSEISRGRLRGPAYVRVTHNVYAAAGEELDVRARAAAALLVFPDAVICGLTAAVLQRLPVDDDGVVHLSRGQLAARTPRAEVKLHRLDILEDEHLIIDGVAVTDGPRTLSDLANKLSLEALVAVADVVARRYDVPALEEAVGRSWGRAGVVRLREAVRLADPGADSPAETRARIRLHACGFTKLQHKVPVLDEAGEWLATPDLADRVARVAVQHEGAVHFEKGERQRVHDVDRDELTRERGWEVVVSTALDDADPARLVRKVTAAYFRSAERLGQHVLPQHLRASAEAA